MYRFRNYFRIISTHLLLFLEIVGVFFNFGMNKYDVFWTVGERNVFFQAGGPLSRAWGQLRSMLESFAEEVFFFVTPETSFRNLPIFEWTARYILKSSGRYWGGSACPASWSSCGPSARMWPEACTARTCARGSRSTRRRWFRLRKGKCRWFRRISCFSSPEILS